MAPCLFHLSQISKNFLESSYKVGLGSVREASKKTRGSTQNKGNTGTPSHYGWRKKTGDFVTNGALLAKQHNLRFCPGLNVGFGGKGKLYAKVPGKVYVTCEKTNFDSNNWFVKKWYPDDSAPIYKKYFNVIPKPQHQMFKLVERI